jgi:hypothetical protein
MRKIELEVLEAIRHKFNRQVGNTAVVVSDAGNIQVLLHGSPIVRIEDNEKKIFVSLAGFNTAVTRARINTVLEKYGIQRIVNTKGFPYVGDVSIAVSGWFQVMSKGVPISARSEK